ncbi:MAG: sulfatase-like hydrolase/transferase [Phycisphaerae bacterium]|jgi:arylsulfatase A-like enzyme|nr:sulfatase-like hydrolase/transferase [Phycisphaerae bacterium]
MRFFRPAKLALIIPLVVIAAAVWFYGWAGASPGNITHVILISIDTCRADYLSCYGYERETTPNIDALAREGVLFEKVVSPLPQTFPTHASMFTGTIPPFHQIHNNDARQLDASYVTLAEVLKEAGFSTGAIVSTIVLESQLGLDQGFDYYSDDYEVEEKDGLRVGRRAEEASSLAIRWLEEHKSDDKAFLFLHYYDPHYPYVPPEPFASTFAHNVYAGEIAYTDNSIGRVIEKLKGLDLYDSSLIIITSDHGEMLGEHGEYTHAYFIYESAIKVPLIVKLPGGPRGKRIDDVVGIIDILPTICAFLEISSPEDVQGQDLSVYFTGSDRSGEERYFYCESLMPTQYGANSLLGVVTGQWKYIQTTRPELYDLDKDPHEMDNLVDKLPRRARLLQERLKLILDEQSYKGQSKGALIPDPERRKQLESLGYVGGFGAEKIPQFDQSRGDPKDLFDAHRQAQGLDTLVRAKKYENAKSLCENAVAKYPESPFFRHELGRLASLMGNHDEAIRHFTKSLSLAGDRLGPRAVYRAHRALGFAYFRANKFKEAITHLKEALRTAPDDPAVLNRLASIFARQGRLELAVQHWEKSLVLKPNQPEAEDVLNTVAWLKAVSPKEKFHDPRDAIRLARRACELTDNKRLDILDTLAVAYAAAGRFGEAVSTAEAALVLARDAGDDKFVDEIQGHLNLFKRGQPYHETE